jgi:dihydrofolate reductase
MSDFFKRIDSIFLGRKSYQMMTTDPNAGFDMFAAFKKFIFSNTLKEVGTGCELVSGNIRQQVEALKSQPCKDIWLIGGAALTTSFITEGLIDEISLAVHPILLGQGKPLFSGIPGRIPLTLTDSKAYSSGLVTLTYSLARR